MPIDSEHLEHKHSLGKGEVLSSILSGSTRYAHKYAPFAHWVFAYQAVAGRTKRKHDIASSGVSVDSVHGAFTGGTTMDMQLEATRRDLINRRTKEHDPIMRQRLGLLIDNLNKLIADPNDAALKTQFGKNVASFEKWMAERP